MANLDMIYNLSRTSTGMPMNPMHILLSAPQTFALTDAHKMHKFALANGVDQAQWNHIAQEELDKHGSYSMEASKYKIVGIAAMLWISFFTAISLWTGTPSLIWLHYVILGLFFSFAVFLVYISGKERTNAAVAAAVLRHRVQGYSNDQISIFKDRPEFQNCTSTLRLLDSMKTDPASLNGPNLNA